MKIVEGEGPPAIQAAIHRRYKMHPYSLEAQMTKHHLSPLAQKPEEILAHLVSLNDVLESSLTSNNERECVEYSMRCMTHHASLHYSLLENRYGAPVLLPCGLTAYVQNIRFGGDFGHPGEVHSETVAVDVSKIPVGDYEEWEILNLSEEQREACTTFMTIIAYELGVGEWLK